MSKWFDVSSFVLGIIGTIGTIVVAYMQCKTTKRYTSSAAQIVKKALNQERLNHATEIINKASKLSDCAEATFLSAYIEGDVDKFSLLMDTFYDLEYVCVLLQDDVLPQKAKEFTCNQIVSYLSGKKVRSFVESNQQTYPKLWEFVKTECKLQ